MDTETINRKIVVIGDTHFCNQHTSFGYIDLQIESVKRIIKTENPGIVVFLGDIFHARRPDPYTLVKVRHFFDWINSYPGLTKVYILRGNHDTASKSDSNICSVLQLFSGWGLGNKIIPVIDTQYLEVYGYKIALIPHYESEQLIRESLDNIKTGPNTYVFGHFGFIGGMDSVGEADGFLSLKDFKYRTFLGHIHKPVDEGLVSVVGTPYSTSFHEADNPHRYWVIEDDNSEYKEITWGIRHMVLPLSDLEHNKDLINDPNYDTLLKVYINYLLDSDSIDLREKILEEYNVKYVDLKYIPLADHGKELQSRLPASSFNFELTDDLINQYCEENTTSLSKDILMQGLEELKNEHRKNKYK